MRGDLIAKAIGCGLADDVGTTYRPVGRESAGTAYEMISSHGGGFSGDVRYEWSFHPKAPNGLTLR
jgi:hypothetical protein